MSSLHGLCTVYVDRGVNIKVHIEYNLRFNLKGIYRHIRQQSRQHQLF